MQQAQNSGKGQSPEKEDGPALGCTDTPSARLVPEVIKDGMVVLAKHSARGKKQIKIKIIKLEK